MEYYRNNYGVLHNIDCLRGLKELDDKCIDLTVTSPPYDNLRTYKGYSFDFEGIAKQLYRVTKDGGVVVWIVNDSVSNGSESGTSFKQALYFKEIGFNLHDTMIWYKGSCPFPENTRYYQSFEYMFVFCKGKIKTHNLIADRKNKWYGDTIHGKERQNDGSFKDMKGKKEKKQIKEYGVRFNVWETPTQRWNMTGHPSVFPEQLVKDHILTWSNEGDIVMDIFMGSGTTAKMAEATNRKWLGYEISEEYCKIAKDRMVIYETK